jgi:hypothetical protein
MFISCAPAKGGSKKTAPALAGRNFMVFKGLKAPQ